ncbi:patatin-like phospholipase domain-containing protein 4 [Phodopus roborovskii]|uniref:patatin-like phospholipase domain-containing protein 4 n=1 Tax=Phodopus roborovskii TaxID=109678 RepID=UPI0021E37459|nr:patatin-like phospholipase domain-containing protein 4 [Phodopus roborovskii]
MTPLLQTWREKALPCAITHRVTAWPSPAVHAGSNSPWQWSWEQMLHTEKPPSRDGLDQILPAHAHVLVQGRLYVSLTAVNTFQNCLVSQFLTREDLIQVLLASCFIPIYSRLKHVEFQGQMGGAAWADGALLHSLPLPPGGRTLTISPFCGRHGISPRDPGQGLGSCVHVTGQDVEISTANVAHLAQALFQLDSGSLESLYHDGFCDAMSFLRHEDRFW